MPKQKIRTAILSYGMSGEVFHLPLLEAHPGFEIVSIWHRSDLKPVQHRYRTVSNYEGILQDPSVELVIVNTPNETHHSYALRALAAGKHVVVEKPFTVTTQEADELMEVAKKQNRILTIFQNRRWDADFLTVKRVIGSNLLGKLVECEIHYDRFRNYIEAETWKEEARPGTGVLYNLGSHLLDQVVVLFGMPGYVDARTGTRRQGGRVDDFFDIRMEFGDLLVILKSSYLVKEPGPRFILHGTQGSFIKSGMDPQEQALKDKKIPGEEGWGIEPEEQWGRLNARVESKDHNRTFESVPGNYLSFYDNVFGAISQGLPLAVTAEDARKVIELIEACRESHKRRCAVQI